MKHYLSDPARWATCGDVKRMRAAIEIAAREEYHRARAAAWEAYERTTEAAAACDTPAEIRAAFGAPL